MVAAGSVSGSPGQTLTANLNRGVTMGMVMFVRGRAVQPLAPAAAESSRPQPSGSVVRGPAATESARRALSH